MPRRSLLFLAVFALAVLVAVPALAATPGATGGPAKSPKPPGTPVTLTGTIAAAKDSTGKTVYTLQSGGTTYTLEAGPSWFFGDNHPLKGHVGKSVTIIGEKAANANEVDVKTVNGTALRGEGKPPWAGGWKRVGKGHPGWTQDKADRMKAKFGDCFPPGQCKSKPARAASPSPAR